MFEPTTTNYIETKVFSFANSHLSRAKRNRDEDDDDVSDLGNKVISQINGTVAQFLDSISDKWPGRELHHSNI